MTKMIISVPLLDIEAERLRMITDSCGGLSDTAPDAFLSPGFRQICRRSFPPFGTEENTEEMVRPVRFMFARN
jgi:hypothetical protein